MTGYEAVMKSIQGMATGMGSWATLLAAVGAFAMALLEFLKGFLPMREVFNRDELVAWIAGRAGGALPWRITSRNAAAPHVPAAPGRVLAELLDLSIGGPSFAPALFDQPVEKMMGQIQAAANVALEYPNRYPDLYRFLCHPVVAPTREGETDDATVWALYCARIAINAEVPDADAKEAHQARVRLDNLARRRLDALQARIAFRWARLNQFLSVSLGAVILWLALQEVPQMNAIVAAFVAILGGMLAPLAKDLASALSDIRLRK